MNLNEFPTEILQLIFSYLNSTDVINCRKVCKRWRTIIYSYFNNEEYWRKQCRLRFSPHHEECHKKCTLSWRELYNSLIIWEKVDKATVTVSFVKSPKTEQYYFIGHDAISCSHRMLFSSPEGRCDTLGYYNLICPRGTTRARMEYHFRSYFEDKDVLIYDYYETLTLKNMIMIRLTLDNVTTVYSENILHDTNFLVFHSSVYYEAQFTHGNEWTACLWRLRYKLNNQPAYLKHSLYLGIPCPILDVSHVRSENATAVLRTNNRNTALNILSVDELRDNAGTSHFEILDSMDCINRIKCYDLDWTKPNTLNWLKNDKKYKDDKRLIVPDIGAALSYLKYAIVATKTPPIKLNIYYNPYNEKNELIIDAVSPILSINLNEHIKDVGMKDRKNATAKLIGVLEIVGGHKITLIYCSRVLIVDLIHPEEVIYASEVPAWSKHLGSIREIPIEEKEDSFDDSSSTSNFYLDRPGPSGTSIPKRHKSAYPVDVKKIDEPKKNKGKGKGKGKKTVKKDKDRDTDEDKDKISEGNVEEKIDVEKDAEDISGASKYVNLSSEEATDNVLEENDGVEIPEIVTDVEMDSVDASDVGDNETLI